MDHPTARATAYPYLVSMGVERDMRSSLPAAACVMGDGMLELRDAFARSDGVADETARQRLLGTVRDFVRRTALSYCVVWSPDACTYVSDGGPDVAGAAPPAGDTLETSAYASIPFPLVSVRSFRLPASARHEHLCVRRLGDDRVEVASASPAMIGYLDEPCDDARDPSLRFLDEAGTFAPPTTFRGVRVTGVADGPVLLGPLQPDGEECIVVKAWPSEVWAACRRMAGRKLPAQFLADIWRAIDAHEIDLQT